MDQFTVAFLTYEATMLAILAGWLMTARGRAAAKRLLIEMRRLYVIYPLRAITGRRSADYAKIRRLERELLP